MKYYLSYRTIIKLFTRMCNQARSSVQLDPILLSAFWRDKTQKFLSFLRTLEPTRTFGSYRFFKGIEPYFDEMQLMTPSKDIRSKFLKLINLDNSRVLLAPHITFICGGKMPKADEDATSNHSIRNMFMNLSARMSNKAEGRMSNKAEGFKLAENFEDWKDGYSNLSDFENDIASLSSIIVIILESPGSLAELGLFYANEKLRQKMVVVVNSKHHKAESFIKFGILSPLEDKKSDSVLVYEIDSENIDSVEEEEVKEIVEEVFQISDSIDKSTAFDKYNNGHLIFLIFQIIDLFTILTSGEIAIFLTELDIKLSKKKIGSVLYILQKFKLIVGEKRGSQTFYYVPPEISNRVEFTFKEEETENGKRRYDSGAIKLEVISYYRQEKANSRSFHNRMTLWDRRMGQQ